jgi:hypothetical protein
VFPENRRIAGGALLYTSAPLGILLAGWVNDLFMRQLDLTASQPDLAWRLVFLSGLVPAAVALWIRRYVRESDVWANEQGPPPRLVELFAPAHRRATLGGLVLAVVTLLTWWTMNAFLPFIIGHGAVASNLVDQRDALIARANTSFTLGGFVGTVATIPAAHLGRRTMFASYLLGAAVAIWTTYAIEWHVETRILLLSVCGFMTFGIVGAFSFYFPELFPTRLRGTGSGFCFNTGRYLAAVGPFLVGRALSLSGDPADIIKWVAVVPLVGCVLTPFAVETHGAPRAVAITGPAR